MQIISSVFIHNYFQFLFIMLTANTRTNFLQTIEFAGSVTCLFCFSSVSAPFFLLNVCPSLCKTLFQLGWSCEISAGWAFMSVFWTSEPWSCVKKFITMFCCTYTQMWSSAVQGKKTLPSFSLFFLRYYFSSVFPQVILLTANIYVKRQLSKCTLNFRTLCNCVSCGMKLVNWTGIVEEQQS